ncbi:hypothetical protein CANMA_005052 [Candida margitis]|uniref:uncharacterized protein n=1 Tax=Candida margitis TaxID=1775924 RepID=UPI002226CE76|nr:uncharacterized protein CANMA_005052 [Candida margitis]KAI5952951.1 hypothetical protein CANMA_005052 [Candida margitis]
MASGSTFDGEIREIPGVYVDNFSYKGEVFFLTHSHSDHLKGLLSNSFCSRVYCSQLTKDIIALEGRYGDKLRYLSVREYNQPFEVQTFYQTVTVTMLETYHCPGSSMFLFECANGISCLATGDIRAEEWWVSSLIKNRYLFPYITGLKKLDQIYLDTTFSCRGEPYISIMPNSEGIMALIEFLKLYPIDKYIEFSFIDAVSGSEEVWLQVLDHFNGTLDADSTIIQRLKLLKYEDKDTSPTFIGPMIFNVGNLYKDVPLMITIKHAIDFNIVDYAGFCLPKRLCDVDASNLTLLRMLDTGHQVYSYEGNAWLLPLDGEELLPTNLLLMFSRHSSYKESIEFVRLFKPKSVFPCVASKTSWLNGFTVGRVFGHVCSSSDHLFDVENFKKFGHPPRIVFERPVSKINRWSFAECKKEVNFVKDFITRPKPFKGQMKLINSQDYHTAHESWCQDFKLQSIIAGRGEEKYKRIINYHLNKDLNLIVSTVQGQRNHKFGPDTDTESVCSTDYDTDTSMSTENSVVASSCVFEKSFSEAQPTPACNFLSPGLNLHKIAEISDAIRSDRRSWNSFKLKSVKPKTRR